MTINLLIKKHQKLWQKFLANLSYWQVSRIRKLIKIFKALWFLAYWPIEIISDLISLFRKKKEYRLPAEPKILIIKIDQLGDLLFSTWLLPAIKKQWPASHIDYLINPKNEAVLKDNPNVNNIYHWNNRFLNNIPGRQRMSLSKIFKNYSKLKIDHDYDLVINGRAFWPSSNRLARKLGKTLVAFDISQLSDLADIIVPYDLKSWEEKNYQNLLRAIGVAETIIENTEARGQFFNFQKLAQEIDAPYWVLAPVSFDPEKTWEKKKWIEFSRVFLEKNPGQIIIASGTKEQAGWLEEIKNGLRGQNEIYNRFLVRSDLDLGQLASLIKGCQGFIGLESFAAHLAIALDKPVSCLVNTNLFYVPGISQNRLVDGRSMLPEMGNVKILKRDTIDITSLIRLY
ncbi:MAG: glycosyltransferase family 9 protein [Patescibacteria group bacterium]